MQSDIESFFNAYRDSFPEGAAAIAAFYFEPCMTAREGVVRVNQDHAATTQLFTPVDEQYRARGFKSGNYVLLDLRDLGPRSKLATLRWSYMDEAGKTIWETTFSYNLYRQEDGWKILVQTMHDE